MEGRKDAFGRYQISGELGRGAMSIVYRGFDPHIKRELAIKTPREEYARRAEYRKRFLLEARVAGTLTHPGIITIFDIGVVDQTPFMAMELLRGETLDRYMARHPRLPVRTVLKMAMQLADALDYAHRQGVVHRDIKPDNVFVTSEAGDVKLMDFGIAQLAKENFWQPGEDGYVAGTPHYMAPEQIRGKKVDGRGDLYALGVLMYRLLSGQTPFRTAEVSDLLRKVLTEETPPLKPLDPHTPPTLISVVGTLLARDPAERYQSGVELLEDLRQIDDELAERQQAWSGRRIIPLRWRWPAIMGALVAVTMILGTVMVHRAQSAVMTDLAFDYGQTLSSIIAGESAENLLLDDDIALRAMVREMAQNREILWMRIQNPHGEVVAGTETGIEPVDPRGRVVGEHEGMPVRLVRAESGERLFLFEAPIRYQQHEVGHLQLGLSARSLDAASRTTLWAMLSLMLVTMLTVLLGVYILSRRLQAPMETLRRAMAQIGQGRLDGRIRLRRQDDFQRLFATFNAMADSLQARMYSSRSRPPDQLPATATPEEPADAERTQRLPVTDEHPKV